MAVAHSATTKASNNVAATTLTTASVTPVSGDLLILGLASLESAAAHTVSTVTWNSISMTQDKTTAVTISAGGMRVSLWSLPVVTGAAATGLITFSRSVTNKTYFWMRITGAATSSITDSAGGAAVSVSAGTAATTGAFTSTASTDFWITLVGSDSSANPATFTVGSGWTIPTNGTETNGATNLAAGIEYIPNPGATSETGAFTLSSSNWAIVGMAYKVLSAGGVTIRQLAALGAG